MENEEGDVQLDNVIQKLDVAEYQEDRLCNILASRLDTSNPVAIPKRSSRYSFESEAGEYLITIEVDVIGTEYKSTTNIHSFENALKSPIFIITCALFSAIVCVLTVANIYAPFLLSTSFPDEDVSKLDDQYSMILDRCGPAMKDDRPSPRSNGALYATCEKAMVQLDKLCKEYAIAICQDQRLELYHVGK
ncbi:MAG: hypothetical protein M3261_01960 [Thermoproteota archaeon]|nr:hypothetical protein [Thermoproteota archaeon]